MWGQKRGPPAQNAVVPPMLSSTPPFLEGFLLFAMAVWAWELYLDMRQRRRLGIKEVPKSLEGVISPKEFESARQYSLDRLSFKMVEEAAGTSKTVFFYAVGGLPLLWSLSLRIAGAIGLADTKENELWHSVIFAAIFYTKETIESLPWWVELTVQTACWLPLTMMRSCGL